MKNKNKLPFEPSVSQQMKMWGKTVFELNTLVTHLPIEIRIIPHRKGFSDEWLKENGFSNLIDS